MISRERVSEAERQPGDMLAELARRRTEFERAERTARTYLAERGVLDQTWGDLAAALKRLSGGAPRA